jgi:hypothetical protein
MKVPPRIKDEITKILYKKEIAMMLVKPRLGSQVEAEQITAEEVLNTLVESGLLDDEYKLIDSEGSFDEHQDELAQACVLAEINKQLQA